MIDTRSEPRENEELQALIAAAWNEELKPGQRDRLDELLLADDEAMEFYLTCMAMHGRLLWQYRGSTDQVKRWAADHGASEGLADDSDRDARIPAIVPIPCANPSHSFFGSISQGGWTLSYLTATVILGVMLLSAWAYKISSHQGQIALPSTHGFIEDTRPEYVARITGMKDCRSADGLPIYLGSSAILGRKFSLSSGLLELTYRSGARVILEGPCEYTVDSDAGGRLHVGKLVARVEKRGGLAASAAGAKHQAANLQSPAPSPQSLASLSSPSRLPLPSSPTSARSSGSRLSHREKHSRTFFQGRVSVAPHPNDLQKRPAVLSEGESASVAYSAKTGHPTVTRLDRDNDLAKGLARAIPPDIRDNGDAYGKLVLSLNPAVYYRMEKPTGQAAQRMVIDSTSGSNNGKLYSRRKNTSYSAGRFGYAINLGGSGRGEYVIVPDYPKADNDSLTVSAWVLAMSRPRRAIIASNWGVPGLDGPIPFWLFPRRKSCGLHHSAQRGASGNIGKEFHFVSASRMATCGDGVRWFRFASVPN